MIRALGAAFVIAAVLASVLIGLIYFFPRHSTRRPAPPPEPLPPPARIVVLAGESAERAVILKDRYGDPRRAEFTDRSLAAALELPGSPPRFVEVWVVNRGPGELRSLDGPVTVTGPGGSQTTLRSLRDAVPAGSRTPRAEMLVSTLSPDPLQPLRKGAVRRTVYVMPASVDLRTATSGEVDGVRLAPRETTESVLEAFAERPRLDLLALLSKPEDSAETRGQPVRKEGSR